MMVTQGTAAHGTFHTEVDGVMLGFGYSATGADLFVECRKTQRGALTYALGADEEVSVSRTGRHWVERVELSDGPVLVRNRTNSGKNRDVLVWLDGVPLQRILKVRDTDGKVHDFAV